MNVELRPEFEQFIREQVRQGHYGSVEDALNAAVAQLQTQAELSPEDIADLQAEVDIGIAQADREEFVEFTAEEIIAECRAEFHSAKKDSVMGVHGARDLRRIFRTRG